MDAHVPKCPQVDRVMTGEPVTGREAIQSPSFCDALFESDSDVLPINLFEDNICKIIND